MALWGLLAEILFVGHSLVGMDLPPLTEAALRALGQEARVEAQVINGAPLRWNWDHAPEAQGVDARARLAAPGVAALVLTEAQPVAAHVQHNDPVGHALRFIDAGLGANPGLQPYLYETWPDRKTGTPAASGDDPGRALPWRERLTADLAQWEGIVAGVNAGLPAGAAPMRLIPAGQAMARLADAVAAGQVPGVTGMDAFFADDIHLSPQGTYFVAMVQAAALAGQSPEGLPARLTRTVASRAAVIADDLAPVLQRIAWETVESYTPPPLEHAAVAPAPAVAAAPVVANAPDPAPAAVPAPAAAAAIAPVLPAITNPNLTFGLNGVADWSVQQPFIDVMKTARPWVAHLPGQWGALDHDDLATGGWLDADGWPRAMPPEVEAIATLILTDLPPDSGGIAGRYRLTWQGGGEVRLEGRATILSRAPGEIWFDFTPGIGNLVITLAVIDPADPIRAMHVVREDRIAAFEAGEIFNPDWLARLRGVQGIRFMDWMATNNAALARLEDRPKPTDYTWGRHGVPMEVMVDLANTLGADPWFTMPHLADDALVRGLAMLARDGLDPGLTASVEYSNEVWNWGFGQAAWARDQAVARWGDDKAWLQFYALRAAEVAAIWADVFGPAAADRLQRVVTVQTGWLGLEDQIFAPAHVLAEGRSIAGAFDAYAVTGYFGHNLGSDDRLPMLRDWLARSAAAAVTAAAARPAAERAAFVAAHRFDLATGLAAQELRDGSISGDGGDSVETLLNSLLTHHAQAAAAQGLRLVMYEGGTHVVGHGAAREDPEITAFFAHLNYSPQMADLYLILLQGWRQLTEAPFNAFVDVAQPAKYGSWGALRHLTDDNPRWRVLADGCATC